MPEASTPNSGKKARLGRGLGSLLSGSPDLSDAPPKAAEQKVEAKLSTQPAQTTQAKTTQPMTSQATAVSSQPAQGASSKSDVQTKPSGSTDLSTAVAAPVPTKPINEEAQIWMIPIDRLTPNTQQPRKTFTHDALRDLTASIKEQGILQPITARRLSERQFEIIAGERRWRAAQAAGLHQVPVILKSVSEQVSLELAIIENMQREDLNPLEEAEAIEMLLTTYKLTQQLVADKLGKERSSVANSLRLLSLPREIREMVRTTELSAGHAKVLLGADNPQTQIEIAKQVLNGKLSVRATEKLVAKAKSDAREKSAGKDGSMNVDVPRRLIDGLAAEIQKLIGTKVAIDYSEGKGKMNIHFYTDDQLTSIVEKLRKSWEK